MSTTTIVQTINRLTVLPSTPKPRSRRSKRSMASRASELPTGGESSTGQKDRVKRFHSKSRKGCFTCRQRRVKCDEQRNPNCARCDKGGYICEWQDTHRSRSRYSDERSHTRGTRSPSLATTRSDDDSGLSHRFFSEGIAVNVATLFTGMAESFLSDPANAANVSQKMSDFYHLFVLQASLSSTIIRKALTALCGLYERVYTSSVSSSPRHPESITYYSEAVTDLRYMSRDLTPDIVLIISILFANCEYLMGDLCSAMQHLQAGTRILREHSTLQSERITPELSETLNTIFEAFGHHAIQLNGPSSEQDAYDVLNTPIFDSLAPANDSLLQIYSHTFALRKVSTTHPRHVPPAIHGFQRWSDSWAHKTLHLEQSLNYGNRPWLNLLQGQHHALNSIISHMSNSSDAFPPENQQLDELVLCMSSFFEMCPQFADPSTEANRPFLDNVGLLLPLFIVILRCPDTSTCHTALSLVGRLKIQEGVWNSCCAYTIAEHVITARHDMAASKVHSGDLFNNVLPIAEMERILPLTNDCFEVTIGFPHMAMSILPNATSTVIVGSFCACPTEDFERLRDVIEAGGYQGSVKARRLDDCTCRDVR